MKLSLPCKKTPLSLSAISWKKSKIICMTFRPFIIRLILPLPVCFSLLLTTSHIPSHPLLNPPSIFLPLFVPFSLQWTFCKFCFRNTCLFFKTQIKCFSIEKSLLGHSILSIPTALSIFFYRMLSCEKKPVYSILRSQEQARFLAHRRYSITSNCLKEKQVTSAHNIEVRLRKYSQETQPDW